MLKPFIPFIAAENQTSFMDEVVECLSVASCRPRHKSSFIFGRQAMWVAFSLVLFLLATQKK